MATKQQAYQVILELLDGSTGNPWVDTSPSASILEEINVDLYKDGAFLSTKNPDNRLTDNLVVISLSGGSGGDTDAYSIFLESTYTGTDNIIISSVQILLEDGMDTISITEPDGVATTFREMVVQTWRRFFKKTTLASTKLEVYNDADVAITEQIISNTGGTKTVGDAT
jgi:hypothetical protein